MAEEQKIEVGQIWRRKKNGRHIRIESENRGHGGAFVDDWNWRGHDYKGRGASYGSYIRRDCELIGVAE